MRTLLVIIILLPIAIAGKAQQFLNKASIEFEVKTNVKKTMGNSSWADMLKENMPQFKTAYFQFTFSGNKSIYKFNRWADGPKVPEFMRRDDEINVYYFDHALQKLYEEKAVIGSSFYIEDSIPKINWRFTNESREIAGFNCRKAVGVIMDSVYIFAFYTDEILISGGPCSISGLPGMILGLTIPRMYVSFIATKISVNGINEEDIKPVAAKKYNTIGFMKTVVVDRAKEWSSDDDENSKKWREQFIWRSLL